MDTIDKISNFAHEAADQFGSATSRAADALGEKGAQLKNAERRLMKNCRGYVCDNPGISLGIAAGVGFLLSRLLRGR